LKEYFRHKKMNKTIKKNQSVQTEKFLEDEMLNKFSAVKRRQGSMSATDRRANKTLMNVLTTFAKQNTSMNKTEGDNNGNLIGEDNKLKLLPKKSVNPFANFIMKKQATVLGQAKETQIKEEDSALASIYSGDQDDDMSVMSEELFGKNKKKKFRIKDLSTEEALKVIKSHQFKEYFMESSRYLEKVLNLKKAPKFKRNTVSTSPIEAELLLQPTLETQDWFVGDLAWSPFLPSVFLTTYFNKEDEDPSQFKTYLDLLHIWNVNFPARPEKELISHSKIQTAKFNPLSNETIVVGFESGGVGLFDLRASKKPVLKSLVCQDGHKSAVTCIDIVGTENSNCLVSLSEGGRICEWDLAKMSAPTAFFDMNKSSGESTKDEANFNSQIEPMCVSHVPGDSDLIYFGDIDNDIHQLSTQKLGLSHERNNCLGQTLKGHKGPVNVLRHNKMENHPNFQGLMLSGSFDWTIKLWNPKLDNSCRLTFSYHYDEITDLSFNSLNPFMFSSVDSAGLLCINTLYGDTDEPLFQHKFENPIFNSKWDNSGKLLALSDDNGHIQIKRFKQDFFDYTNSEFKNLERIVKK
jgi:WD40 repeat protein/predicted metal-dependent hydrolase